MGSMDVRGGEAGLTGTFPPRGLDTLAPFSILMSVYITEPHRKRL